MGAKKKVIVVGAGFAGVHIVRRLEEKLFDVLLIDKINHHQFQPLFYQVATSQLEPASISFPIRHVFRNKKNLQIRLAEVIGLDSENNTLSTSIGSFEYDYLVIATGCTTNFYGNSSICRNSFPLKTTYDAILIRNHLLKTFEKIVSAEDIEKEGLLNLVIVGAGPTGVELAGALAEIKSNILPKDYPGIDFAKLKIILVEGSENTLNSMSTLARENSRKYLERMGVTIKTETFVKDYDGLKIELSNGESIKSKTVIWAAGITGNIISGLPDNSIVHGNRILVDRHNKVYHTENVYAIGDVTLMKTPKYPDGHPQVANVAINQAKNLAKNLKRNIKGKPLVQYEYQDLGSMATIGRNKAVVDFNFISLKGYFAWFIWMFLHLMLILSVKNKLIIFINWAWAYITKNTSLRIILSKQPHLEEDL